MSLKTTACMSSLAAILLSYLVPVAPVRAGGFIVIERPGETVWNGRGPRPPRYPYFPLEVKNHNVTCTITDTVGVTKVDQVFHNPNPAQLEGTYMFPLPETAAVQKFSMWMNGQEVKGELLEADKARKIYEDIVRQMKDPALLEYVGQRLYRARVFPIPGNGDVRVALEYTETIPVNDGQATYRYPLNTEKYSSKPLESVTITVDLKSNLPLRSVFCPSHPTTVSRPSDKEARVGFEAHNVTPDKDFVVNYLMSEKEFGLSLLSCKPPGEDGYFLARVSPPFAMHADKILPKDIVFVLDTSGSMAGEKIAQAKKALLFCLSSLRPDDRFNLITFATDVRAFKDSLVNTGSENIAAAKAVVEKLEAAGGTAIDEALKAALKTDAPRSSERPFMVVFITDGEPTIGERNPDKILANVKDENRNRGRLFVFGVGHDLNARLLDRLGDDNNGTREYVDEKEDLEIKVSSFYKKISDPVLSAIELKFGGAESFDVYPKDWPDLFHGSELVVVGRYHAAGAREVVLTGQRGGQRMTWTFPAKFADSGTEHTFLPRLWATRKIGYLMDEIRLHGEKSELKDEIISLAKRHAIITPYTSYLVVEEGELRMARGERVLQDAAGRRFGDSLSKRDDFSNQARSYYRGQPTAGRPAVEASKESMALRQAPAAPASPSMGTAGGFGGYGGGGGYGGASAATSPAGEPGQAGAKPSIQQIGSKIFYLGDDGRWVDSTYDGKAETKKIAAFSDDYFSLLQQQPDLGKYLALGQKLIVVLDKVVYEIQ